MFPPTGINRHFALDIIDAISERIAAGSRNELALLYSEVDAYAHKHIINSRSRQVSSNPLEASRCAHTGVESQVTAEKLAKPRNQSRK